MLSATYNYPKVASFPLSVSHQTGDPWVGYLSFSVLDSMRNVLIFLQQRIPTSNMGKRKEGMKLGYLAFSVLKDHLK